jgi:putative flippase GtrA
MTVLKQKWNTSAVVRYAIVGVWNVIFAISFLYILFFLCSTKYYQCELAIAFFFSAGQSFISQRKLVWKSTSLVRSELLRFLAGNGAQYLLNSFFLYLLKQKLHLDPKWVALPLLLLIACCFYFVNKHLVFKEARLFNKSRFPHR